MKIITPLMDVVGDSTQNEQGEGIPVREGEKGRGGVNTFKLALGSMETHLSDKLCERA